ncbi:MAG: NUDIX domain-containing protein [Dehalococcoidia bacterium]|nr:MAG: NUDIX domain-containing protein [Dehalococcoidia bacterium]
MTDTRRREVAVGLIVDDGGQLLLQHRDADPSITGAGLWGFFGGHLEPGEAPSRAFLREMAEELGWQPRHFEHYLTTDAPPLPGDKEYGRGVVSHVFAAHLDVPLDELTLGEGQAMALCALDALPQDIVPGLVPVIEEFARSQAYRRVRRAWDMISTTALPVDARGRLLLQLRDDKPDIVNPGLWGSFGGRLEPHETDERETPEEGFLREMEEELGWRPRAHVLYDAVPYRTLPDGDARRQLIYIYAAAVDVPPETFVLGEGQAMAFFAPDELPANIVPALRALIERFTSEPMYREMMALATGGS